MLGVSGRGRNENEFQCNYEFAFDVFLSGPFSLASLGPITHELYSLDHSIGENLYSR